jgi:thiol-disulfide isomerase/thioredoxin
MTTPFHNTPRRLLLSFLLLLPSTMASEYLYRSLANDGGSPIIDYYDENDLPDFLYQDDFPHHRVVEFYSHLCPHCQRFAPHYIEFGRKFNEMTQETTGHYANLEVKFYAISCYVHRQICKQEKITGYPTVKVYKANSKEGMKMKYFELHPDTLVKKLGVEAVKDDWQTKEKASAEEPKQLHTDGEKVPFMARRADELFGDAYLSFHTAMKTSVFLDDSNQLEDEKAKTLGNFLTVLERVLPPWRIHALLGALLGDGDPTVLKQNMESEEKWMSILEQHPPQSTEYSAACKLHDSPFTCGLWTLVSKSFHLLFLELNRTVSDPTIALVSYHDCGRRGIQLSRNQRRRQ